MTTTMTRLRVIEQRIDRRGYIKGISCHLDHGGNRGMVLDGGYAHCQGCGSIISVDEVWRSMGVTPAEAFVQLASLDLASLDR